MKKMLMMLVVALMIGLGLSAEGSVIISQLNSPADLDLSGDIIYAINFGTTGNPTVGGVMFSQDEVYPYITHSIFYEASAAGNSENGAIPPQTGDDGLNQLLDGFAFTYSQPPTPPDEISINVGNISVGKSYLLQIIFYEAYGTNRNMDFIVEDVEIITGLIPIEAQGGVRGQGGFVIKYKFMAADPVLNIGLVSHYYGNGLSGFTLTEIPEPATLSFLALGSLTLLRRKQKL